MLIRNLQARHLNMIALGSCLGTGIFLASGYAIHVAGPGGALLAYSLISLMVFFLITSLGELATYRPTSGSFCEYSSLYVHKSFGFGMSYNYWFNWAVTIPTEIGAAALVMQYWYPDVSIFTFGMIFFGLIFVSNFFSIRLFGEAEYWMSFIKIGAIIVFIVLALFLVIKDPQAGIRNFVVEDAPFHNGWAGFIAVFLAAGFAFQGSELIGVSAGESRDPQKSIPRAVKNVFWRLLVFYILTTLLVGLLIPFNDPHMTVRDVSTSPFTLVFNNYLSADIVATIMNIVVLTAIVSAANASFYAATRTLWYMGTIRQAPHFFSKTTKQGAPLYALFCTGVVAFLVLLLAMSDNQDFFNNLFTVSSLCGYIAWFGIALSHYCFRKRYLKDDLSDLTYKSTFFPWAPIISMLFIAMIMLGQGFTIEEFTVSEIIVKYGALIAFVLIIIGHKLIAKPEPVNLQRGSTRLTIETSDR